MHHGLLERRSLLFIVHLDRLRNGSTQMGLGFPWSNEDLILGVSLLDEVPVNNYYIRPIVYRSVPQLNFSDAMPVDVTILAVTIARDVDKPLTCHISTYERVSGRAIPVDWKICGTYVNSYLSRRAAEVGGFDDAIMLDQSGRISEATAASFSCKRHSHYTCAYSEYFPGITRSTLLDVAKSLGLRWLSAMSAPQN